jgi:CRISPR/Cas system-associated protein Cas10 (large subunit of type III CRISPR-Cas system)
MDALNLVRTAALLHDIGKPACWARNGYWEEHVQYTYNILKGVLGEDVACAAMRHHAGESFDKKYLPRSEEEKIISLADRISSGLDIKKEGGVVRMKAVPPFKLTHPLSQGDAVRFKPYGYKDMDSISTTLLERLKVASRGYTKDPDGAFNRIFVSLRDSVMNEIPWDICDRDNDVSLWQHSRLTAAIASCIVQQGGIGEDGSCSFKLLSGDADKVSSYVLQSTRLPDLNARSARVKDATEAAKDAVEEVLGVECVLYAAGGSLLALAPPVLYERAKAEAVKVFEREAGGGLSFTVTGVDASEKELPAFGDLWERADANLRRIKLEKTPPIPAAVELKQKPCDVCRVEDGIHEDKTYVLNIDVAPRRERLCERCWKLREAGQGTWINKIFDTRNLIAVLKADGDRIGSLFSGSRFKEWDKDVTPSRLAEVSSMVYEVCEKQLGEIVRGHGGQIIYTGGDDILAVLPGNRALPAALELSRRFSKEMNGECTMSAGVVIMDAMMPIYAGLEESGNLLQKAKKTSEKNSVAFTFLTEFGGSEEVQPMSWDTLRSIIKIVDYFQSAGIQKNQLRHLAQMAHRGKKDKNYLVKAEAWLKYQTGRGVFPLNRGEELLGHLASGRISDAFLLFNLTREVESNG